jgi:hypothetical protein
VAPKPWNAASMVWFVQKKPLDRRKQGFDAGKQVLNAAKQTTDGAIQGSIAEKRRYDVSCGCI